MEKLNQFGQDIFNRNINLLKNFFPEVFNEGKIEINKLKEILGEYVIEGEENYKFTWHGKNNSGRLAYTQSNGALRPIYGDSSNWKKTKNIFIEGDNLEVLKLLQNSYHRKVKMIYIDPPYNTGKEFIYPDKYQDNLDTYLKYTNQIDEAGYKFSTNTESLGRFHTNWLNMIYPRLRLARNLLCDDGVLFVSIGQSELSNLVALLDGIFGEENRISICTRMMKSGGQKGKFFSPNTDYVLVYAKNISNLTVFRGEMSKDLQDKVYNKVETEGNRKGERYRNMGLYQPTLDPRPNQRYYIECPDGSFVIPPGEKFPSSIIDGGSTPPESSQDKVWRWTYKTYLAKKENIHFIKTDQSPLVDENGRQSKWNVYTKIWLNDRLEEGLLPLDLFDKFENRHSSKELQKLDIPFDYAKPTDLLCYLMQIIGLQADDIVLDFFAGSASIAHAVMKLNCLSNINSINYVCCQLPEKIRRGEKAYQKSFRNIADVGKERIRRAAKQIMEENPNYQGDLGFKVFKLDSSNFKNWDPNFDSLEQDLFDALENIKKDRSNEDIMYELLIKYGLDLNVPIETIIVSGKKFYSIGLGALIVCLDKDLSLEIINAIGKLKEDLKPEIMRVVFKDDGFKDDVIKTNALQALKLFGIQDIKSI